MLTTGIPVIIERDGEDITVDLVELDEHELTEYLQPLNYKQHKALIKLLLDRMQKTERATTAGIMIALQVIQKMDEHPGSPLDAPEEAAGEHYAFTILSEALTDMLDKDEHVLRNPMFIEHHVKRFLS